MKRMAIMIALGLFAATSAMAQAPAPAPSPAARGAAAQTLPGRLTLYNQTGYNGEDMEIDGARRILRWDYHPRSIGIHPGERWEICARPRFEECIVLDRSVPDAELIGIPAGSDIGSIRPAPVAGTGS
jgi:hypothetical protein